VAWVAMGGFLATRVGGKWLAATTREGSPI